MFEHNEMTYLRKSLATELLKIFFGDCFFDEIDKIPIDRAPLGSLSLRCCVYKDRALYRYRLISLMGINIENDDNEYLSLADFANKALDRSSIDPNILNIIDLSCASCQQNSYIVTGICKGCVARPCESNCPKNAIQIINHKALINQDLCVSCGICLKACPYNAIVYSPVPCEVECPVDAISRNIETGKEEIDYDKCIYCGRCTRACPFGTIMERSQILDVAKHIKSKSKPLIALVAPSIVGQFSSTTGEVIGGLKNLGFDYVYEVAFGADITAKNEAKELIDKLKSGERLLGTSCCPAYVESVKKHVKDFRKYLSTAKTPMAYIAEIAKKEYSDSIVVFIGPCVAKKFEGANNDNIDYVLTYEELSSFFESKGIVLNQEGKYASTPSTIEAKRFCLSGGVATAVEHYAKQIDPSIKIDALHINGLDKKGIKMLDAVAKGKLPNNLVECMSCEGGCLAGPGVNFPISKTIKSLKVLTKPKLV